MTKHCPNCYDIMKEYHFSALPEEATEGISNDFVFACPDCGHAEPSLHYIEEDMQT